MGDFSTYLSLFLFLFAGLIIWIAGIELAKTTDTLDSRFKLGDALGGLILLGIATTLPEIAILIAASLSGQYTIILGNLIGGISVQTLAIVIFDFTLKGKRPLSYLAGSKILCFEAIFVIFMTLVSIFGMRLPRNLNFHYFSPISVILIVAWVGGLYLLNRARKRSELYQAEKDAQPGRMHHERRSQENHVFYAKKKTSYVIWIFALASLATLIAGVMLEKTGSSVANHFGIGAGLFAGTIMALVTALPEISTGIESILIKDNQLAISDIFGGNSLMPALFIVADLISKKPILPISQKSDIVFAVLGVALTLVYAISLVVKPKKRYFRLGADSIVVIIIYAIGLFVLSRIG
ncbi:MAG: sodium:calcium antiporter [Candidatus Berkelbacteria bacterium]|nr:sodium:calcium antiporter [Candidatus Berkelbacteria bacterium]